MNRQFVNFVILILSFAAAKSVAECTNSAVCANASVEISKDLKLQSDFEVKLGSTVLLKTNSKENKIEISKVNADSFFYVNPKGYYEALDLGAYSVGQGKFDGESANQFKDVLLKLNSRSSLLTTEQKLLVLKEAGGRLSNGYDETITNQKNSESVFENSKNYQKKGGICGDIHNYLSQMASELGFDNVGTHIIKWSKDPSKNVGHIVTHFRDPQSGKYYIQNYQTLVATNAYDLATAVDTSTKIQGVLTSISMVEGRPGVFHAYTPEISRWIYSQVDKLLGEPTHLSKLIIEAGVDGAYLGLKLSTQVAQGQVSGFALGKVESTESGKYQVGIIGVELKQSADSLIAKKMTIGFKSSSRMGLLHIETPAWSEVSTTQTHGSSSMYYDIKAVGFAKVNQSTAEIEILARNTDAKKRSENENGSVPEKKIKLRFNQNLNTISMLEVERSYAETRFNYDFHSSKYKVEADKFSIVIDARNKDSEAAYLKINGDYYFLEGVDASSARAVRLELQTVIPEIFLNGRLQVILDISKILSNPKNDSMYNYFDQNTAVNLKLAWVKQLNQKMTMGIAFKLEKNRPYYLFQQNQSVLNSSQRTNNKNFSVFVRVAL
jgi:hypothetical protein